MVVISSDVQLFELRAEPAALFHGAPVLFERATDWKTVFIQTWVSGSFLSGSFLNDKLSLPAQNKQLMVFVARGKFNSGEIRILKN